MGTLFHALFDSLEPAALQTGLLGLAVCSALFSAAVLLAGATARACRLRLGAAAAYSSWLLVPATLLGVLAGKLSSAVWQFESPVQAWVAAPSASLASAAVALPSTAWGLTAFISGMLLLIWLLGVCTLVLAWVLQHRRTLATLWQVPGEAFWRMPSGSGPALVGAWHLHLCVPQDFELLFTPAEQQAVLAHEQMHRQRRDNAANLAGAALLALQWFNPWALWALRRMRADQELACDAAVLALPVRVSVATYTRALLKAQGLLQPAGAWAALAPGSPAAMLWSPRRSSKPTSNHPFIERIAMLKSHAVIDSRRPNRRSHRRNWVRGLAASCGLLCLVASHALQPPAAAVVAPAEKPTPEVAAKVGQVMLSMQLDIDGTTVAKPRMLGAMGERMSLRWQPDGRQAEPQTMQVEVTPTHTPDGKVRLQVVLSSGEPLRVLARPVLITADGAEARVELPDEPPAPAAQRRISLRIVPKLQASASALIK
jgi:beta-lactamase regulating signal transducer with metallopeptidase domain